VKRKESDRIKWKYLAMMGLFFVVMIGLRVYFDMHQHRAMVADRIEFLADEVHGRFNDALNDVQKRYTAIGSHYFNSGYFNELVAHRERRYLEDLLSEDYATLRRLDPDLYVMHVFDPGNVTILRMHKPQSYDDNLTQERPAVVLTNRTRKPHYSFETGKNGITYRITLPIVAPDNRHLGVLEFGIEPEYFVRYLKERYAIEAEVLVRSETMAQLSYETDFKKVKGYSVVMADPLYGTLSEEEHLQVVQNPGHALLYKNGRTYIVLGDLLLRDIGNQPVAKILVAEEITAFIRTSRTSLNLVNGINVLIALGMMLVLYLGFERYVSALQQSDLRGEAWYRRSMHYKNQAETDGLTQVFNRLYFNRILEERVAAEQRSAMVLLDIDHFKQINDTYGHVAGDRILIELAERLRHFFRHGDRIVRWGGEEFIVVMEESNLEQAREKAEALRRWIAAAPFADGITVTISGGVARMGDGENATAFLQRIDALLYRAKSGGRNRIVCEEEPSAG